MSVFGSKKPPEEKPIKGLRCPVCECRYVPVLYTRPARRGVLRVRRCNNCGHRIRTYER